MHSSTGFRRPVPFKESSDGVIGRFGLVGHSEGPMIAARVAARQPAEVDFVVSMAGGGLPGLDLILLQDELLVKDRVGTLSLEAAAQPFLRVLLMADPRADWRAVRCPALALNGSLDIQVPPASLAGIVASLKEGGNGKVESMVLPSLNHLFQTAKTGSQKEYAAIEETIAPFALQRIAAFVRKR